MTLVELYSKEDCSLCDEALSVLEKMLQDTPFTLRVLTLIPGEEYYDEYKEDFPVIHINKRFAFKHRINENVLRIRLQQVASEGKSITMEDDPETEGGDNP